MDKSLGLIGKFNDPELSKNFDFDKGISKNAPFPLQWRGIKGEAKQIIRVLGMPLSLIILPLFIILPTIEGSTLREVTVQSSI